MSPGSPSTGAGIQYEADKFAEALGKFQAFEKDALAPGCQLRIDFCLVQLKPFDEAAKVL